MATTAGAPAFSPSTLYPGQRPPPGDWHTWLCLGGEGAGKTYAASVAVLEHAMADPEARILVVGSSISDVLRLQVGVDMGSSRPSSILALAPSSFRPIVRKARRVLEFSNGARVFWASAADPDKLRGYSCSLVCARSLLEWRSLEALEECRFAARLVTTRMREEARPARLMLVSRSAPTVLLRNAVHDSYGLVRTCLSTYDNEHNLSPHFMKTAHALRNTTEGRRRFAGELSFVLGEVDAGVPSPNA